VWDGNEVCLLGAGGSMFLAIPRLLAAGYLWWMMRHFQGKAIAALNDEEGARLPLSLPPVVDAHVHLFPDRVFESVWRWFDTHGWPIRYKLKTPETLEFLFSRGVTKVVALHYAHKPGMARMLNEYVAALAAKDSRIIGLATVLPGEPGAREILKEAFASGLRGVKLHCHVQCFAPDAPELHEIYEACVEADVPLVMHAGREPASLLRSTVADGSASGLIDGQYAFSDHRFVERLKSNEGRPRPIKAERWTHEDADSDEAERGAWRREESRRGVATRDGGVLPSRPGSGRHSRRDRAVARDKTEHPAALESACPPKQGAQSEEGHRLR
jgi:hypothetical protein